MLSFMLACLVKALYAYSVTVVGVQLCAMAIKLLKSIDGKSLEEQQMMIKDRWSIAKAANWLAV